MNTFWKDVLQLVALYIASLGGIIAAIVGLVQMSRNRRQRVEELKWRKARELKHLIDKLREDSQAKEAMYMLDYRSGREYQIREDIKEVITEQNVLHALERPISSHSLKDTYIRDCFDRYFDHLDALEYFVSYDIIELEDVKEELSFYVKRMSKNISVFYNFVSDFDYNGALKLLLRFEEWSRALENGRGTVQSPKEPCSLRRLLVKIFR